MQAPFLTTDVATPRSFTASAGKRHGRIRISTRAAALALVALLHAVLFTVLTWTPTSPAAQPAVTALAVQLVQFIPQPQPPPTIPPLRMRLQTAPPPPMRIPEFSTSPEAAAVHEMPSNAIRPSPPPTPAPPTARDPPPSDYVSLLARSLAQVKRYPAAARQHRDQGTVMLLFTLDRTGKLLAWHIARTSGSAALDAEVREMIAAANPFPPFPASMKKSYEDFLVPIEFSLK